MYPLTDEEVAQLQRENRKYRVALERIAQRAADDIADLPDKRTIPHVYATGCLLSIQGLAESALGE